MKWLDEFKGLELITWSYWSGKIMSINARENE
jgi:hypothetical protein